MFMHIKNHVHIWDKVLCGGLGTLDAWRLLQFYNTARSGFLETACCPRRSERLVATGNCALENLSSKKLFIASRWYT